MLCRLVVGWNCKVTAWNTIFFRVAATLEQCLCGLVASKVRQTGLIRSYSDSLRSKSPMIVLVF
jgi:hypothetical protein